jgi:predicted lipoprotein with Yx(FWY)xxD motif
MSRRSIVAVAVTALLAMGGTLVIESAAVAATSGRRAASAPEKNDKKKKKKVVLVKTATTPLGKILVDAKGFTLYAFDPDGTDTVSSKCIDACANVWPALVAKKKSTVGKGLKASLFGIGGGGQAAYNDHLLYHFANDTAAGQTNGQGIGGVWHVVGVDGEPIP